MKMKNLLLLIAATLLALFACKKEISETEKAMTAGDLLLSPPKSDYAGAREQYSKAIAIDPTYDKAYIAMAQAYEEEGDYKNAAKWYEKFTEVTKSDDMRRQAMGWKKEAEHNLELMAKAQPKEEKPSGKSVEETIKEEREKAVAVAVKEAKDEAAKEIEAVKAETKKLRQSENELKDQIALLNEQKEDLERKLSAFKDSDDITAMLKSLEATEIGPELAQQVVKLKNDNTSLASRVKNLDEVNARLREENSTLKAYIKNGEATKDIRKQLVEANKKYDALLAEKSAADAQLKELRAQTAQALSGARESEDSAAKAQALALTLADRNAEITALKQTIKEKDNRLQALETQTAALTIPEGVDAKDISEEITQLRKDLATLQKQAAAKDSQITYLRNELNKENGGVTRSEAEVIKQQNAELHQQVAAAREAVKGEQARREEVQKQMAAQTEALRTVPPLPDFEPKKPVVAAETSTPKVESETSGFRPVGPQVVQPTTPVTHRPKVYQVKRGDTLYGIAERFYGDAQQWRKILRYNKEELRSANALKVGQRLYIPD